MALSEKVLVIDLDESCENQRLLSGGPQTCGMRSGRVYLQPGKACGRHSTKAREELLVFFAGRQGRALTRDQILNGVWGYNSFVNSRTVDRFVTTLRGKVEPDPHSPAYIHTVRSIGYKFEPAEPVK